MTADEQGGKLISKRTEEMRGVRRACRMLSSGRAARSSIEDTPSAPRPDTTFVDKARPRGLPAAAPSRARKT